MTRLAFGGKWNWPLRMPRSAPLFAAAANSPAGFMRLASATPPSPIPKRLRKPRRESPAAGSGPVQIWWFIRFSSALHDKFVKVHDGVDQRGHRGKVGGRQAFVVFGLADGKEFHRVI